MLFKLLKQDPDERIGCWESGVADIKQHPFFRDINWDAILMKQAIPPFIPTTNAATDVQNVAAEFLSETIPEFGSQVQNM